MKTLGQVQVFLNKIVVLIKFLILIVLLASNEVFAQNLVNPYSFQGYSLGVNQSILPLDITISQMGLGIGIPSPYSYIYPVNTYNPYDAFYNSYYSNFNPFSFTSGNQFQQFQAPSLGAQLATSLPSLLQDYFNRQPADHNDSLDASDNDNDQDNDTDGTNSEKDDCKKLGDKKWNGSECISLESEIDCNQEIGHIWSNGVCKFKEDLTKDECDSNADMVWDTKCVDISSEKSFCDKFSELTWIGDKCYKANKITSEICGKDPSRQWNDTSKSCENKSTNSNKPISKCKENEIPYKELCLSNITKEYCLDASVHNGHAGTWFHDTCWDIGCDQEDKKTDKICIASKKESDNIKSCSDSNGEWVEAKRDTKDDKKWIEGHCSTITTRGSSEKAGEFGLFITNNTNFLISNKMTDGQHPNMTLLSSCLKNINSIGDKNIQYNKEKEQYSFRDTKKGQYGFTIVNKDNSYFVEDRDLIKIRDDNCKDEIEEATKQRNLERSKLKCSVNFNVGERAYTVIFSKENILANNPQYFINDTGEGKYISNLKVNDSNQRGINYKNLYLGVENIFKETAKQIRENCSKDYRKYTSDAFIGKMLNFSGACDAALSTGWRDQDVDNKLVEELKNAINNCKIKFNHNINHIDVEHASSMSK